MSSLITFSQAWSQSNRLFEALGYAQSDDAILLTGDAVLAMQSPLSLASFVAKCQAQNIRLYALQTDLELRGIENQYPAIEIIDFSDYVKLVVQHSKQVAW